MRKKRIISVVLVMVFMFVFNVSVISASEKSWSLYTQKGAPSSANKTVHATTMPSSGTNLVYGNMKEYSKIQYADIKVYRSGFESQGKYLTAASPIASFEVARDKSASVKATMSTTRDETIKASGVFTRG